MLCTFKKCDQLAVNKNNLCRHHDELINDFMQEHFAHIHKLEHERNQLKKENEEIRNRLLDEREKNVKLMEKNLMNIERILVLEKDIEYYKSCIEDLKIHVKIRHTALLNVLNNR